MDREGKSWKKCSLQQIRKVLWIWKNFWRNLDGKHYVRLVENFQIHGFENDNKYHLILWYHTFLKLSFWIYDLRKHCESFRNSFKDFSRNPFENSSWIPVKNLSWREFDPFRDFSRILSGNSAGIVSGILLGMPPGISSLNPRFFYWSFQVFFRCLPKFIQNRTQTLSA